MRSSLEIRSEHDRARAAMRELNDHADAERRDLSRRESARYDELDAQATALEREYQAAREAELGVKLAWDFDPRTVQRESSSSPEPASIVLGPQESVAAWTAERGRGGFDAEIERGELSLGRMIRGAVTGKWDGARSLQAALFETGGSSGAGYLIPEPLAARLIDRVRNASRVFQAGAQTVPMTVNTLSIARLVTGADVSWKLEGDPISSSDMTFDRVTFQAHTLPILVRMSQELFEDLSPEATDLIENEMAQALSLELDRVALYGSGVDPEPEGIAGQAGVAAPAQVVDYDSLIDIVSGIRQGNHDPQGIIWNPDLAGNMAKLRNAVDGNYLVPPAYLAQIPSYATNQVAAGDVFVADWRELMVGIRTDLRFAVRVLDQRFADTLEIGLLTYLRADVQLAHAEAFAFALGTT